MNTDTFGYYDMQHEKMQEVAIVHGLDDPPPMLLETSKLSSGRIQHE